MPRLSASEMEALFRVLDARYLPALVPTVRIGIVTAALNTGSYSIRLPGETGDRDGVPSVAAVTPQVGDGVRVELVGDPPAPVIVDRVGPKVSPQQADVAPTGTTTSTTYTGTLTTGGAGPSVTLDLVAGQPVLVTVYARLSNAPGGAGHQSYLSWAVSGASTRAAVDADAVESQAQPTNQGPGQKTGLYVPPNTGSHTIAAQYKTTTGDTATFVNRRIIAVPL